MIVTVFRSRLLPEAQGEYMPMAKRMSELAETMPGYIAHKTFVAEDGERLTLVEFQSEEGLREWAIHPEHMEAKKLGRQRYFAAYRVQTCNVIRDSISRPRLDATT
jgi:heme-degrading monooxygenase HmoA